MASLDHMFSVSKAGKLVVRALAMVSTQYSSREIDGNWEFSGAMFGCRIRTHVLPLPLLRI